MTDYGTVVLAHLAAHPDTVFSAAEVAVDTRLTAPSVRKLLKVLSRAQLVDSYRGATGGYTLARDADSISAAEILDALEGPVALTECSGIDSHCHLETVCGVGQSWQRINRGIREALKHVSLAQLAARDVPDFSFDIDDNAHNSDSAGD